MEFWETVFSVYEKIDERVAAWRQSKTGIYVQNNISKIIAPLSYLLGWMFMLNILIDTNQVNALFEKKANQYDLFLGGLPAISALLIACGYRYWHIVSDLSGLIAFPQIPTESAVHVKRSAYAILVAFEHAYLLAAFFTLTEWYVDDGSRAHLEPLFLYFGALAASTEWLRIRSARVIDVASGRNGVFQADETKTGSS